MNVASRDDFRSKVLFRSTGQLTHQATRSVSAAAWMNIRNTKVSQVRESQLVHDNILWFDIAMNHPFRVNMFQSATHARDDEGHIPLLEANIVAKKVTQITSEFEVKYHIAGDAVMKGHMEWDNKRMLQALQSAQLVHKHLVPRVMLDTKKKEHLMMSLQEAISWNTIP